jgi:hypothetical protein
MGSNKFAVHVGAGVGDRTLEAAPERLLTFLRGLGKERVASALMSARGWSDQREKEAYELIGELRKVGRRVRPLSPQPAVEAFAWCEDFQAIGMVCARALLEPTHPDQAEFLFHDHVPGEGAAAVVNAAVFVDRYRALGKSPERKATRKADLEALELIHLSGTTAETVKELAQQIEAAQSASASAATTPAELEEDRQADERRRLALRNIYAFLNAWTQVARAVVKRRDLQIRLGIARRHAPVKKKAVIPGAPAPGPQLHDEPAPPSRAA